MNIVIIGCGDVGIRCAKILTTEGHKVTGVRRNVAALPDWLEGHAADVTDEQSLQFLSDQQIDLVIYVLAAAAFNENDYRSAYVTGVENTLNALGANPVKRFIFVSSTGVYHQNDGQTVDENSSTEPVNFNGRIVLQGERLVRNHRAGTCVRFSGIYGPDRLRMINRVAAGQSRTHPDDTSLSNRIHVEDCAGVLAHLVNLVESGAAVDDLYLASDSSPATTAEVEGFIATTLGLTINQASDEPIRPTPGRRIAGSKRCSNQRLLDSGYHFIYPDYKAGYKQVIDGLRD